MKIFIATFIFSVLSTFVYGGGNSSCVYFEQSRESDFLNAPMISKGFLVVDSSGNFRWQINVPYKSVLILFKGELSQFELTGNDIRKLKMAASDKVAEVAKKICAMAMGNISSEDFEVSKNGLETILIPRNGIFLKFAKEIKIRFASDNKNVSSLEISNLDGDRTSIKFLRTVDISRDVDSAFDISKILEYIPPEN